MNRCLFLGYNNNQSSLIRLIKKNKWKVIQYYQKRPSFTFIKFDLIISFGYRHIIPSSILKKVKRPIINLHMSYLPYNKGAHPNFWSFMENTPKGVSIHEVSKKIDSGPIILRKKIKFTKNHNTYKKTYKKLKLELENLFKYNIKKILSGSYKKKIPSHKGTFHKKDDLPKFMKNWNMKISISKKKFENQFNK